MSQDPWQTSQQPQPPAAPSLYPPYPPMPEPVQPVTRHSGFGIASFVIAMVSSLLVFGLFIAVTAVGMDANGHVSDAPGVVALVFGFFGALFLSFIGLILGITGLIVRGYRKVFATLGVVFNALLLGLVTLLFALVG